MTPEQMKALIAEMDGAQPTAAPALAAAPESQPPMPAAEPGPVEQPGILRRVAGDIGTGITELPRAIVGGARDAVQETMNFGVEAANAFGTGVSKIADPINRALGLEPTKTRELKAPTLPDLADPKSVTGGFAKNISQFITGMVGLGKIVGPIKAVGKAGKMVQEVGRAATVGAVAFDPYGPRLADMVEGIPGATNALTQFLSSNPGDTAAEGRFKNALESIGMDVAVIGALGAAAKLYKANKTGTEKDLAEALAEANRLTKEETRKLQLKSRPGDGGEQAVDPGTDAGRPLPEGGGAPLMLEGGAPGDALSPAPPARDVLDLGSSPTTLETLDVVQGPSAAAAADGAPKKPKVMGMDDADVATVLDGIEKDIAALETFGSWEGAVAGGHVFGKGGRVPWQKLAEFNHETGAIDNEPVLALIGRLADAQEVRINAQRGGSPETGIRTDAVSRRMLNGMATMFNQDPAAFYGLLERIGAEAPRMQAAMEAGFMVTQRGMQDAYRLAARVRVGDLDEWGGDRTAALESVKQVMQYAMTAYGHAASIMTNSGRALRRMRSDFAFTPEQLANLNSLDGEALVAALERTGGDPRKMVKVINPTLADRTMDAASWLYANNLLWGLKTHAVNLATNAYMVAVRPAERMIGGKFLGGVEGERIFEEGWRQYTYLTGSIIDGWRGAVDAWRTGDSTLSPHSFEGTGSNSSSLSKAVAEMQFKPMDSIAGVIHNALAVPVLKTLGAPTRALGVVDELVKQGVYRSKVQAQAHVEALRSVGLTDPKAIAAYVEGKLLGAFDDAGRATDQSALQEARIATFQQELLPETWGRTFQNLKANHPSVALVLPFVKTPANVIRMGVKLTPGLNLAQKEYRDMLSGVMGAEVKAQAMGQMAVGSLFLGTAASLAVAGSVTGGGPSDKNKLAELKATGWQPYSFVYRYADGRVDYVPFNRFDPVAVPFGIVADLVAGYSIAKEGGEDPVQAFTDGATAALLGIAKQMSNKTYLMAINQVVDALSEPDKHGPRVGGQMTANVLVPAASGLRFWNPDPLLRDARSFTDQFVATIPGLSEKLPAKRDMWGDPIVNYNRGFTVPAKTGIVDFEMRRMLSDEDSAPGAPSANMDGVDLRDITMADGRNAYDAYQELARQPSPQMKPLKEAAADLIENPAYFAAPDGDARTKGTKLFILYRVIDQYRETAGRLLKMDPNVREATQAKQMAVVEHYANRGQPPKPDLPLMTGLAEAAVPANRAGRNIGTLLSTFGQGN